MSETVFLGVRILFLRAQPDSFQWSDRYGLEGTPDEPSQEEIEAAARLANADKFIENMPQK